MKLSRVNTVLVIAIVLINGFTIALPFVPALLFWAQDHSVRAAQLEKELAAMPASPARSVQNRLIIPSMLLDEPIFEGKTARTLRQGLWHRPLTSAPNAGGNTVIVGHRFTYSNPHGTLYHLDKVKVGDHVGLVYSGQAYRYKVQTVRVVHADDASVEAPSTEPRLTIYTCTPLWWPKDRLVVVATPLVETTQKSEATGTNQ